MLIYVDTSLKDQAGHYFNLAASLYEQATQRGLKYRVLAHRDVGLDVRRTIPAHPVFRQDFHHTHFTLPLQRPSNPRGTWYDLLRANVAFYRDLRSGLGGCGRDTTVFMGMTSHRELLGWSWWLRSRPARLAPEVVLMFRLNYVDVLRPEHWESISDVASFAFRAVERVARTHRVRLATDSERLAAEFAQIVALPMEVLPIPHTEHGARLAPADGERDPLAGIHFLLLGDLREEKGFPTLLDALRKLHDRRELTGMRFTIQAHIASRWHEHMADYRRALEELRLPGIELIAEPLHRDDYYRLIASSDFVVLPYDRPTYYSRTSGPLVEAFAAGKAVIASDDTWMSDQIRRFGAGLTFRAHDSDDLARALLEARTAYHELMRRAAVNRTAWLEFHNPSVFVEKLLGRARSPTEPAARPRGIADTAHALVESAVVRGALKLSEEQAAASNAERAYQADHVNWLRYHQHRLRFAPAARRTVASIDCARVWNALPNNGALPVKGHYESARDVVTEFRDPAHRGQGIEGYEGFAPDDAVFDEHGESHEVWSNAELAAALADFAYDNYENPSVLDLGCGPAHLFFLLQRYGIRDYMGIDGNPLLLDLVPHVRGHEDRFRILDLQQEIRLQVGDEPVQFDLICSFEVLEHIREDKLPFFLATVANHMHPGSTFFCTASILDDMDVHVLVRPRDWWISRFAEAGFTPLDNADALAAQLADRHPFNWSARTTNVFVLDGTDSARCG